MVWLEAIYSCLHQVFPKNSASLITPCILYVAVVISQGDLFSSRYLQCYIFSVT